MDTVDTATANGFGFSIVMAIDIATAAIIVIRKQEGNLVEVKS